MTQLIRVFYSFLLLVLLSGNSFGSHLLGGSMRYQYVSETANTQTYKVSLVLYRDQSSATNYDNSITFGVHNNDASKSRVGYFSTNNLTRSVVSPPSGGSGCSFLPNISIEQGIYEVNITVPRPSTNGYIITWLRCCRTSGQVNIANDMGAMYACFIPATSFRNNSPYFIGVPAPYICANDQAQVANSATDPDGDSLVYSVVQPWTGGSSTAPVPYGPTGTGVPAFLPFPFTGVTYNSNFSAAQPFGATGVANINASTGLCDFRAPTQGNYSVAVEVKEYRNGVYLGLVRRDVILLVLNCPPNPPANLSGASGSGNTNPTVIAGETTCFPVIFNDTQDSVFITSFGDILDGTGGYTGNKAIMRDTAGFKTATTQFCWQPNCNTARALPYSITVQARDNGCPPKISSVNYSIKVDPFVGRNTIIGDTFVCTPFNGKTYRISPRSGSTYAWSVTGGTIVSGQNTSSISVNWPSSVAGGSVTVVETNSGGCVGINNTRSIVMELVPLPKTISGNDIPCAFDKATTYSVPATGSNIYIWGVTGGTIQSGNGTNQISVNWNAAGNGLVYMIERTPGGCYGDTVYKNPTIRPLPNTDGGVDQKVCDPGTVVQLTATGAVNYVWNANATLSATNIANPTAAPLVTTSYVVSGTLAPGGCVVYDTVVVFVYSRPGPALILGNNSLCENTGPYVYQTNPTAGSTYQWFAENGTIVSSSNVNPIQVTWGGKGTGKVKMVETNAFGCTGDTNFYSITIREVPVVDAGKDTLICEGESVQMQATGANIFSWSPLNGLSNANTANPVSTTLSSIRYIVKGYLVAGGCEGIDSVDVTVLNKPILNIGAGDTVCEGTTVELKVLVGTDFKWNTGEITRSIFVTPTTTTAYWVLVKNQKCIFDTLKAFVVVNPKPKAGFIPSETAKIEPVTVNFTNTTTGATSYRWDFGDGIGRSTTTNPTYTYEFPGKYIVKLYTENQFGCTDSFIFNNINVIEQNYSVFIPNVITPDGDSLNDYFELVVVGYSSIKGEIFNRWGNKVYTWKGDNWWDGIIRNNEASDGQYYYFITCEGRRGRKDVFKGTLTVIR